MHMDRTEQLQVLAENCKSIIPDGGLEKKLALGRPLIVKLGLDPTAPDIHLGHVVVLRKLRQFQDLGHTVVLIVGDFTAKIGDPSGKSKTRPALSDGEIKKNAATYKKQVGKILDRKKLQIRFNSEWLKKLKAEDIISFMAKTTIAQILVRDDFRKRLHLDGDAAKPSDSELGFHEVMYPLLQAYDSVAIHADVEIGGTDQTVNLIMGRRLQQKLGQEPQVVMTMPLLVGLDGKQKMSKSLGNYISVTESAENIYGKIMSLPDELILQYRRLLTNSDQTVDRSDEAAMKLGKLHPMPLKLGLAFSIAEELTSAGEAVKAEAHFRNTFQHREFPKDAKELSVSHPCSLFDLITEKYKLFPSKSEARRKLAEGAIRINGKKVVDGAITVNPVNGEILELQIGKLGFYRVTRQKK